MPRISAHPKEESFNFRVDPRLKAAFQEATATEDISAAQVIRNFMRAYIEQKKRNHFAVEMRRQAAILADAARDPNTDEARVMRELEHDLQYFSEEWK